MGYAKQRSFSLLCGIYCLPIVVILAFLALYYFHIERQKEQFSQYFLRQLSLTGSNIRESIENLRINLVNSLMTNEVNTGDLTKIIEKNDNFKQILKEKAQKQYIEKQLSTIRSLDLDTLRWGKEGPPKNLFTDKDKDNVKVNFSLLQDKMGYALKAQVIIIDENDQDGSVLFEINAVLKKLVTPLLPEDVFKNFNGCIVLARKESESVLLETGMNLQLLTLPKEETKTEKEKDENDTGRNSMFLPVRDVEIGLNKYKLFLHPFHWQVNESTEQNEKIISGTETSPKDEDVWLVGALIPQSTFLSKAMTISPTLGLIIFCILCLGLVILPFLRVRLMGRREGVKAHTVFFLTGGLLVGCSMISMLIINMLIRDREIKQIDGYLKRIANDIGDHFNQDFSALEEELINRVLSENKKLDNPGNGRREDILSSEETDSEYPFFELLTGMDKNGNQKWKWSIRKTTTPMLRLPNREYFKYAKDFELGLFEKVKSVRTQESKNFFMDGRYIESIRSQNTGQPFAMLTLRKKEQVVGNDNFEGTIVFGIQAIPLCLVDPVMPPGFGFALIDKEGTVQFHSSSKRNLRENFFMEASPKASIEALSKSIIPVYTDLEYRASSIRAYISPFSDTPWTLIVFSDKSIPYQLGTETITFTAALYGAYLTVLIIVCLVILKNNPKSLPGEPFRMWLWPDTGQIDNYQNLTILMGMLWIIWFMYIFLIRSSTELAIISFIIPFLLLIALLMMIRDSVHASEKQLSQINKRKLKTTYIIGSFSLLISLAVIPPIGFYLGVYKEEKAVFIKYFQYELAQSIKQRTQRLKENYKDVTLSNSNLDKIKHTLFTSSASSKDSQDLPDIYSPGFIINLGSSIPEAPEPDSQYLITLLRDVPLLHSSDKLSIITRMFSNSEIDQEKDKKSDTKNDMKVVSEDKQVKFKPETRWFVEKITRQVDQNKTDKKKPKKNIVMLEKNFQQPLYLGDIDNGPKNPVLGLMDITISTPFSSVKINYPWLILGIPILIMIICWVIKAFMKIIFITNLVPPVSTDGKILASMKIINKQIQIRLLDEEQEDTEIQEKITPQQIRVANSIKSILNRCKTTQKKEIVLDRFDIDLDDTSIALKKLELLEGLETIEDKQVIIRTAIDPLFLLTSRSHEKRLREPGSQDDLLPRWAAVLQSYSKLRRLSEENEYQKLRDDFIKNKLNGVGPEQVKKCLADEGWPNRRLQEYAKKLAGQEELKTYSVDDIVDQFRDIADAHYRKIWLSCSTDEKILLFRLAEQGFVNWRMEHALRSLIRRRIVVMSPNFRLMNESFRQFVLQAEHPQTFQEWEHAAGISVWGTVKTPLILLAFALVAFFFITQREAFSQSLQILSAVAAGIPIIFKVIGALTQSRKISTE